MPYVNGAGGAAFNGGTITQPLTVNAGDGSTPAVEVTSAALGSDYEGIMGVTGADGAGMIFYSDGSLIVTPKQTDATFRINKTTGPDAILVRGDGTIILNDANQPVYLKHLPTSDPGSSGQLFTLAGVLHVSP